MKKLLLLIPCLSFFLMAQDKPVTPKPLTPDEKNAISRAEVVLLRDQQAKDEALKRADQQLARDSAALNTEVQKVYAERKIKQDDWTLCETKAPPYCQDAPVNDLTLQPVKKEDKPKETK